MTDLLSALKGKETTDRNIFIVEIEVEDDLLAGQPKNEETLRGHIEAKLRREAKEAEKKGYEVLTPERQAEIVELHLERMFGADSVQETISDEEERSHCGFFWDENGPYIGTYQVNACMRDMATTLGIFMAARGTKQMFQHQFDVRAIDEEGNIPEGEAANRLYFYRDGHRLDAPDGWIERCAHVNGAQGPRSCINRFDYVGTGTRIRFGLSLACNVRPARKKGMITDEILTDMLLHAQLNGLGARRSQGHGRFRVVRFERITNNPWIRGEDPPDGKKSTRRRRRAAAK